MQTLALAPSPASPVLASNALAVQHNALINACFTLDTLETRLFVAMLGRIRRHDKSFADFVIPVRELAPPGGGHVPYTEVATMVKRLARQAFDVEPLDATGRRQKEVAIASIPLMSLVSYTKASGQVVARFNEQMRPYLLELKQTFTKVEISQVLKLKSRYAHRLYWLLKEYAALGRRTLSVVELRHKLQLTTEYAGRFDHFRTRVLDRAQQELACTDLPFTYELGRQGRDVVEVHFLFAQAKAAAARQLHEARPAPATAWERALLGVGIAAKSLPAIQAQLAAGTYEEGYITYALARVEQDHKQGKVKRKAGILYKALTEYYYLAEYQAKKVTIVAPGTATKPALSRTPAQAKLANELMDAQGSVRWLKGADILATRYQGDIVAYQQDLAEAMAKVEELQQTLNSRAGG